MASAVSILAAQALARGRRRPAGKAPTTELPRTVEREYLRDLLALLGEARELVEREVVPELEQLAHQANPQAVDSTLALDDDWTDTIARRVEGIRIEWARKVTPAAFLRIVQKAGWRTADINRLKSRRQFQALLGLDVIGNDPELADLVKGFVRDNVKLIKSVSDRYFDEVETLTVRNLRAGTRADTLARQIRERWDVTESRAALIARDQTAKLNGDITHARHTALGITHYLWRTSKDDLVRPGHAALEGRIFAWAEPPVVDAKTGRRAHPGGDYQCRCTAEPVIAGINDQPKPRVAPKTRATPARLVPAGVPEEYAKHPLAPVGKFSLERLQRAIPASGTRLTREQQVTIRRELNSVAAEAGMVERGIVAGIAAAERRRLLAELKKAATPREQIAIERRIEALERHMPSRGLSVQGDGEQVATFDVSRDETAALGARAFHDTVSGRMVAHPDTYHDFINFVRTAPAQRTAAMVSGMRTMVHETVHGHSPMHPFVYQGLGRRLEEATTEMAAQALTEKLAPGWSFTFGEVAGERTIPGSYRSFVTATVRAVATELKVPTQKAKDYARAASIAMRRRAGPLMHTYEDYAVQFAQQLPGLRTKVAKAEREIDAELTAKLARVRAGENNRVFGHVINTPEDLNRIEVQADIEAEVAYRKQQVAAKITKRFVDALSAELRNASEW